MSSLSIDEVLRRLRLEFTDVEFTGGHLAEGYWISATSIDSRWAWRRYRMTSPGAVQSFAQVALAEFYGA